MLFGIIMWLEFFVGLKIVVVLSIVIDFEN